MTQSTEAEVAVLMGSDSDWPVMRAAVEVLSELGVSCEVDVVSAHRMPQQMLDYAGSAHSRGIKVIIAGAGGAAHLPGMLASATSIPVIGVPVPLQRLDGMDSLLSIVQMPAGVPVATVSIGGARNAGLLAARILGAHSDRAAGALYEKLEAFRADLETQAHAKGARLRDEAAELLAPGATPSPSETGRGLAEPAETSAPSNASSEEQRGH